ncbi:hypothetical protein OK015_01965 [Mycobacterium sp. Aquia_216]|uniref:hypothetical protein n=1 Tax=Mycobacterium sp. Aquia_216 TaxID=2991729 RepID=UPI00227BEA8F|nr:hypothetical protein [Mycobacterium sp. Aquia_216]WAJ45318.1 hypothetical protein OK015_01965 [Mycobacterium sp. Aquia_216]
MTGGQTKLGCYEGIDESTAQDSNATPDLTIPRWGETRWHCCWSPKSGAGVYIHTGRFRKDLEMWWAHIAAFLPDGVLAVDRFWFRNRSAVGAKSEGLELRMTADGWQSTFDGVGELSSTAALSRASRGCAGPSVPLGWDIRATAAAPIWDINAISDHGRQASSTDHVRQVAANHIQQAASTVGSLWVDGEELSLEGVGFKDHSSGSRSFSAWAGHRFMVAVMPDWIVHAFAVLHDSRTAAQPIGVVMSNGIVNPVTQFDVPTLTDATGKPTEHTLVVSGPAGPVSARVEVVHALPISITEDNDNYNGVDWTTATDPIVMVEAIIRLTGPGGICGYGFLERSARQSALPRPVGVLA